jgi:hypothetical protein
MERSRSILEQMVEGSLNPSDGYHFLHRVYVESNGLLADLKPMFRLGIKPDGRTPVDDEFNQTVLSAAAQWLRENPIGVLDSIP